MNWTEQHTTNHWTARRNNVLFHVQAGVHEDYDVTAMHDDGYRIMHKVFPTLEGAKEWCENVSFNWI
jgi:hypothetical protein